MKPVRKRLGLGAALAALLLIVGGGACAQIAGIEERKFEEEEPKDDPVADACEEYCKIIEDTNPDDDVLDTGVCPNNYTTYDVCLGVCAKFPLGDIEEPIGENSIACRLNAARSARSASKGERDSFCQAAGPGGNGSCGNDCESYCRLVEMDDVCGTRNLRTIDCVDACEAAFGDSNRFHVGTTTEEFDHSGDTVQCRLVHVSTAAGSLATEILKDTHCAHANFHSSQWCVPTEVSCDRYCDVLAEACTGDHRVYEDRDQCEATCAALEPGEPDDKDLDIVDTVACRTYHGVSSLADPISHCSHAGPTGDGHCGLDDPDEGTLAACRPYCRLLEAACPTTFESTFENSSDCVERCDQSDESFGAHADHEYTVKNAEKDGDTLSCRTFYAVRALGDVQKGADPAEAEAEYCPSAFGAAPCD